MSKYYSLLRQLIRFGSVGIVAAAVHFSMVLLLVEWMHWLPLYANVPAFFLAFQCSYWGHRCWTFRGSLVSHQVALAKLLLVQLVNFIANESLFYIFLMMHLPYFIALLLVLSILPFITFIVSKWWVFNEKKPMI